MPTSDEIARTITDANVTAFGFTLPNETKSKMKLAKITQFNRDKIIIIQLGEKCYYGKFVIEGNFDYRFQACKINKGLFSFFTGKKITGKADEFDCGKYIHISGFNNDSDITYLPVASGDIEGGRKSRKMRKSRKSRK